MTPGPWAAPIAGPLGAAIAALNGASEHCALDRLVVVDVGGRPGLAQYHPDRVANAAPELQEQAALRAAEINAAYSKIRGKRRGR